MDEFQGSYAPQSPDLSGFNDFDEPEPAFSNQAPAFSDSIYAPQQNSFQQPFNLQPHPHDQYSFNKSSITASQQHLPQGRSLNDKPNFSHDDQGFDPEPKSASKGGPGRKKKPKMEEEVCDKPAPGVEEGIDVKTKFPVARIKRIMQADEDVGKVAQVTPTAVCKSQTFVFHSSPVVFLTTSTAKALELFMISIVTKAAERAREKGQKRVTAVHLKQALQNDEQFDFLADIIAKVPDAPAPKKKEETEDSEEAVETKKKKRAPTKRRKKDESEDED